MLGVDRNRFPPGIAENGRNYLSKLTLVFRFTGIV
jgi:hypothetical protein